MTADQPCAGCGCEAEHDGDYGASGHPGPCPPHTCSVTADHTPERRLSSRHWLLFDRQHRNVVGCGCGFEADVEEDCGQGDSVIDHLAAHLADVEARLAAVEALADKWAADIDGLPRADACARELRAALHPDPSEGARDE